MTEEFYSVEVIHFTFHQIGTFPQLGNAVYYVTVAFFLCYCLDGYALVRIGVLHYVYAAQSFFAEVFADDCYEIVEVLLVAELCHFCGKLCERIYYVV